MHISKPNATCYSIFRNKKNILKENALYYDIICQKKPSYDRRRSVRESIFYRSLSITFSPARGRDERVSASLKFPVSLLRFSIFVCATTQNVQIKFRSKTADKFRESDQTERKRADKTREDRERESGKELGEKRVVRGRRGYEGRG